MKIPKEASWARRSGRQLKQLLRPGGKRLGSAFNIPQLLFLFSCSQFLMYPVPSQQAPPLNYIGWGRRWPVGHDGGIRRQHSCASIRQLPGMHNESLLACFIYFSCVLSVMLINIKIFVLSSPSSWISQILCRRTWHLLGRRQNSPYRLWWRSLPNTRRQ